MTLTQGATAELFIACQAMYKVTSLKSQVCCCGLLCCPCRLNQQLGFTALEYGIGSGLYFLGYGVSILPSTFATIKYGARRCLGLMTFACGVVGMLHGLINNRASFYVLRCLLGMTEAGGGSSAGHLLAQFYPKDR